MKEYRENPEGEANQKATRETDREIFALKMEAKHSEQLNACPFCGNEEIHLDKFCISCSACGASGPDFNVDGGQASAAWNSRPNTDLLTAVNNLVEIVEGVRNVRWAYDQWRLKDTPEWCALYSAWSKHGASARLSNGGAKTRP